jgi:hypothetical protein
MFQVQQSVVNREGDTPEKKNGGWQDRGLMTHWELGERQPLLTLNKDEVRRI